MVPLDFTTASSTLPSRRIGVRSYPAHGRNTQLETTKSTHKRASSFSSASKRRSVSSMKGLMPLALSPSCSTSSSPSLAEERMGNKVDGYFPEVLAKDLELSNSAFASKQMTSGSPDANLSTGDKGERAAGPSWSHRSISSPYHASSGPVRSLVPIQERNSVVSFLDHHQEPNYDETATDPDSISGTDVSRGPAAPSMSFREQSIITAATSLTSSSWMPSPRNSPPCDLAREHSWIDPESDEDEREQNDDPNEDTLATLSPRPPTPPDSDNDTESVTTDGQYQTPPSSFNRQLHRKSYSVGGGVPVSHARSRRSGRRSESVSQRPAWSPAETKSHRYSPKNRPHTGSPSVHRPRASSLQTPRSHVHRTPGSRTRSSSHVPRFSSDAQPITDPTAMGEADMISDDEAGSVRRKKSSTQNPDFIRPSPPPSPLPSVQSYLNVSTGSYTAQSGDDLAKAVPLPPNVVETLRVSIACFPETMLLTSSLTIETIRNYSKKVRQPTSELASNLVPDSPGDSPRRSLWKRVVSYKRGSSSPERRPAQSAARGTKLKSPSSTSLEAPKTWAPLKNVFGCCSDYICDALWAHIVAYNYISALVPRAPPQPRPSQGRSSTTTDSSKEEIPKKAASLLGLTVSQDMSASVDRVAKKLSSQLPWGVKDGMVAEQSARSAMYESTTRDIQAGLMRCIMRLIATAKLMAEDGITDDRVVEMETRGVDVLFTRSLCEIVRMAEESG